MSTDMQRLVVELSARTKAFENAMNKANGLANKRARAIESTFAKANARIGNSMAGIGKRWAAGLAAGVSAGALAKFSDAATRIDNSLKVAGLSGEELQKTYEALRDSALKNATPIEDLVKLYSRASMAAQNLGASQEDLRKFADNVALSLRVSGKSAGEASGALLQLSQVLGGSVVQAQEYNSLIDGAYPLLQAVASGLKEAGGDVGKLTALVKDGKVPTRAFFEAFQAGSVVLQEKVAGSTLTISQALGNLHTSFVDAVRDFEQSTRAGEKFATGINNLAEAITDFDVSGFIAKISAAGGAIEQFFQNIGNSNYAEQFAEFLTGVELTVGRPIDLDTALAEQSLERVNLDIKLLQETIAKNTKLELDTTDAQRQLDTLLIKAAALRGAASSGAPAYRSGTPGDPNALAQRATLGTAKPKEVSLDNYKLPRDDDKKAKKSEYAREIEQIKERTAALQAETAAMAGLNPLIDDYGFAVEKASAVQELLNAAQSAGLTITPELRASIEGLATGYATAVVEAERLAESQDLLRQSAEEFRDLGKDVMGGFISDMIEGKSAADSLSSALAKVGDKLLEIAMNDLFGGGSSGGGILGSLFGGGGASFLGGGGGFSPTATGFAAMLGIAPRAKGGPVAAGQPYVVGEKRPELFVPRTSGTIIPKVPQIGGGGSPVVVNFNPTIDNRGASVEAVARTEQQLAKLKAELPAIVTQSVRKAQKTNVKL